LKDIAAGIPRRDAIVGATVRRFRPIVLTAATAVLALIPLTRSDFFGPMAVAMMGGIIAATVLTLGLLPALYAVWFRVRPEEARGYAGDARSDGLVWLQPAAEHPVLRTATPGALPITMEGSDS